MRSALLVAALSLAGCASLPGEQLERVQAYRAGRAHAFVWALADAGSPPAADLQIELSAEALNVPLAHLGALDGGSFVPTSPPRVELSTGSALLRIPGKLEASGTSCELTLVASLDLSLTRDGNLQARPSLLAVVPSQVVGTFDSATRDALQAFSESEAASYLAQAIGEIDIPLALPPLVSRRGLELDESMGVGPGEPAARLHVRVPESTTGLRWHPLAVWPLAGRLVILASVETTEAHP